jgi:DNA polymerase
MIHQIREPGGLDQRANCLILRRVTPGQSTLPTAETAAALGWLVQAGVDCAVDAGPRRWLAAAPAASATTAAAPPRPAPAVMPTARTPALEAIASLAALDEAIAGFAHPLARADLAPQLLVGNASAGAIILCDQPEAEGTPTAVLRGHMLAAIGLDPGNCALLHRIPWPTPGGRAPRADELAAFAGFVGRGLELLQPRAILALGQQAAALAGQAMALASARGRWHEIAVGDRQVPMLASLHPRLLLTQPLRKRDAWSDLQAFAAWLEASA